jgi:DNA replicative helicase MCM subunit Mcm2 (Cdc46/Mcm family)
MIMRIITNCSNLDPNSKAGALINASDGVVVVSHLESLSKAQKLTLLECLNKELISMLLL